MMWNSRWSSRIDDRDDGGEVGVWSFKRNYNNTNLDSRLACCERRHDHKNLGCRCDRGYHRLHHREIYGTVIEETLRREIYGTAVIETMMVYGGTCETIIFVIIINFSWRSLRKPFSPFCISNFKQGEFCDSGFLSLISSPYWRSVLLSPVKIPFWAKQKIMPLLMRKTTRICKL